MQSSIDDVLIVGGGTAGWLTAAYLARRLGANRPNGVHISLVESQDIPTIGVGEGTFPTIRRTMATIGVDEALFMRECSAAFKQGIKFVDWQHAPSNGIHDWYYHPFDAPRLLWDRLDLSPYWLLGAAPGASFSEAVTAQHLAINEDRAPKDYSETAYYGRMNYAYHLDAGRLASFLKRIAVQLGVKHIVSTIDSIELDESGAIASVRSAEYGSLEAGLYVDCTGFAGLLIGQALKSPIRDIGHQLFVDRAVAMQIPNGEADSAIASATISTAHEAGWTWDIALNSRRGVGYVYSSSHTEDDRAEQVLRNYIGPAADKLAARRLNMKIGYRERQWVKNCVAVGLSGGFLEPLESTGIVLIEAAIHILADYFPRAGDIESSAALFNRSMARRFESAIEFIKMHFFLTKRTDTEFWRDNVRPETTPQGLLEKLGRWKCHVPTELDFDTTYDSFKLQSYQYVLYGMGFRTNLAGQESAFPHLSQAAEEMCKLKRDFKTTSQLPDHRALLEEIHAAGLRENRAPAS